jgi:type IV pilus assembly protein PilC
MRNGRLRQTVQQVAADLEKGTPLDQAFEKHQGQFPPLYARLVAAGIASSNLPAMLLSLSRHMEMVYLLRATLWRTAAYPLMVLAGLLVIVAFLGLYIVPRFQVMFKDFSVQLPVLTQLLLTTPDWIPGLLIGIACLIAAIPLGWMVMKLLGIDRQFVDVVILRLPLVGSVLRRNMVARWCDAARLGVQGGLDLPKSIELAGDAIGSPALKRDGHEMIGAVESGRPVDAIIGSTRVLPPTVPAAMALASANHDLPATLATLSEMYQQQAQTRLNMIPGLLTPILILIVAMVIGIVVVALFLPFLTLIQMLTGS